MDSSSTTQVIAPARTGNERFAFTLGAILILAFAVRIGTAAVFQGLGAPPSASAQPDQLDYEKLAYHLSSGQGYGIRPGQPSAFRPPGTSWTLLPAYLAFGRSWAAGRIWFALLGTATCFVVALLGKSAFNARVGLMAALWLALYPGHFYYSMHFLSETPFAFWLALAALAAVLAGKRGSLAFTLVAGASVGLATLTRPQGLFCVPLAWVAAPMVAGGLRHVPWSRLAWGTAIFALVVGSWVARNHFVLGHASLSSVGGCTFWGAHNDRILETPGLAGGWIPVTDIADDEHPMYGDEFEIDAQCWSYGRAWVTENLDAMPGLMSKKLLRTIDPFGRVPSPLAYWAFALSWIVTIPFLLAGIVLAWRRDRLAAMTALVPIAATVATVLLFYGNRRFRDCISGNLALPVGLSLAHCLGAVRRGPPQGQDGGRRPDDV